MKKPPPPENSAIIRVLDRSEAAVAVLRRYFAGYFWAILKNVLGFLLILLAFPAIVAIPVPGGGPLMFLVGFALVAFPGKRRITSAVLRGRELRIEASIFTTLTTVVSLLVIAGLLWFVGAQYTNLIKHFKLDPNKSKPAFVAAVAGLCVGAAIVTWGVMWLALRGTNLLLRTVPRMRRMIRKPMRKYGIVILPPPRHRGSRAVVRSQQEIIEFSDGSKRRFASVWSYLKPWLMRMTGFGITVWLFYKLLAPVVTRWSEVEPLVNQIRPMEFLLAVLIFVAFLFSFRAVSWWTLLKGLGKEVPLAPTVRIWSTSELARYLPGVIWQVVGRMYLIKPYGVSGSVCSTSQVLELIIFMLANIIMATGCLLWFGFKQIHGDARWWLIVAISLLPTLGFLLHPSVFYALMNRLISRFKRPPIETRVPGKTLVALLAWNIVGLCVMSFGIWLIVHIPFHLPIGKWWVVCGAYCLAWTAGFVAFWASAGFGVREFVFMLVVVVILPKDALLFADKETLRDFASLLAVVLRFWTMIGELILTLLAYGFDLRGALLSFRNKGLPLPAST